MGIGIVGPYNIPFFVFFSQLVLITPRPPYYTENEGSFKIWKIINGSYVTDHGLFFPLTPLFYGFSFFLSLLFFCDSFF